MTSNEHPTKLFFEVTTLCNLQCGMCVKQNGMGGVAEGGMSPETFERLAPAFSRLDALILNGIGEPLLNPHLETFIARARALLPQGASIGFQSNGMALTDERAASLVDAGLDRICISLDTVSDDNFRCIRSGGELQGVASAFDCLTRAKARNQERDLKIGIEFVLMRSNLADLPDAIRWARRSGAGFAIVTKLMPRKRRACPAHRGAAFIGKGHTQVWTSSQELKYGDSTKSFLNKRCLIGVSNRKIL